jgi:hypothetical protein
MPAGPRASAVTVPVPNPPGPLRHEQTGALAARRVQKASASLEVERGDRGRTPEAGASQSPSTSANSAKRRLDEDSNRDKVQKASAPPKSRVAIPVRSPETSAHPPLTKC